jgi:ABC-2 type transport system ATP-binding protein
MIHVSGLIKQYNDFVAVDGVSFEIGKGEICGLVGHNGAGKTTTMRCLSGLLRADNGDIRVAGFSPDSQPVELKRHVVYVPDDPPLFDDLSVNDHFEFIGRIYNVVNYRDTAQSLLEQFGLVARKHYLARELSRGMRQKVAICLAYLVDPQVMLFDEPMTGLDPQGIRLFLDTLRERAKTGTTIVLSSHLLAMIQDVCSMVMVMHHGRIRFLGTRDELHTRYSDAETLEEAFFEAISENEPVLSSPGALA